VRMRALEAPTAGALVGRPDREADRLERMPPRVVVAEEADAVNRTRTATIATECHGEPATYASAACGRGGTEVGMGKAESLIVEEPPPGRFGFDLREEPVEESLVGNETPALVALIGTRNEWQRRQL